MLFFNAEVCPKVFHGHEFFRHFIIKLVSFVHQIYIYAFSLSLRFDSSKMFLRPLLRVEKSISLLPLSLELSQLFLEFLMKAWFRLSSQMNGRTFIAPKIYFGFSISQITSNSVFNVNFPTWNKRKLQRLNLTEENSECLSISKSWNTYKCRTLFWPQKFSAW